jgi:hypothetical protein
MTDPQSWRGGANCEITLNAEYLSEYMPFGENILECDLEFSFIISLTKTGSCRNAR